MALSQVASKESAKTPTPPETTPCSPSNRDINTRFKASGAASPTLGATGVLLNDCGVYMLGISRAFAAAMAAASDRALA
jgi:hypothetical protein